MAIATGIMTGLSVASTAIGAISSMKRGKQQSEASYEQSEREAAAIMDQAFATKAKSEYEEKVLEQRAIQERIKGNIREEEYKRAESKNFASWRAARGASGGQIGTGSNMAVAKEHAGRTAINALRIAADTDMNVTRLHEQADLAGMTGRYAMEAAGVGAASAIETGAARARSALMSGYTDAFSAGTKLFSLDWGSFGGGTSEMAKAVDTGPKGFSPQMMGANRFRNYA